MINQLEINKAIITGLENELSCPVIFANQTAKAPPYPYCSFTITSLQGKQKGTFGICEDGIYRREIFQTWSFTVQSGDDDEAMKLALKAHDFFTLRGKLELSDEGVVVQNVTQINNRDNLITIEYEHRYGFDVTFSLCSEVIADFGEIEEINLGGTVNVNK